MLTRACAAAQGGHLLQGCMVILLPCLPTIGLLANLTSLHLPAQVVYRMTAESRSRTWLLGKMQLMTGFAEVDEKLVVVSPGVPLLLY